MAVTVLRKTWKPLPSGHEATLNEQQRCVLDELHTVMTAASYAYAADYQDDPNAKRFLLKFLRATMKDKVGAR